MEKGIAFPGLRIQRQAAHKGQHRFGAQDPAHGAAARIPAQRHGARDGALFLHILPGDAVDPGVIVRGMVAAFPGNDDIQAFRIDADIGHRIAEGFHLLQFFNDIALRQDVGRRFLGQVQVPLDPGVVAQLPGEGPDLFDFPVHRGTGAPDQGFLLLPGIADHLVGSPVIEDPAGQEGRQQGKEQQQNNHLQLYPAMLFLFSLPALHIDPSALFQFDKSISFPCE